jgi:crossover junction endodeoxyribonuclease RuvC
MMYYIGVDPGKSGGIAIITEDGVKAVTPMIIAGKDIDLASTANWVESNTVRDVEMWERPKYAICYIEKVSAMPKQGVTSMFNFGFSTGAIHGVIATLGIGRYLVTPPAWKKVVLAGTKKDKDSAIDYCRRSYPNTILLATDKSRKPHSGMADALCIATYALLTHEK